MADNTTPEAYVAFLETRGTEVHPDEEGFVDFDLNGNTYTMSVECEDEGPEFVAISCEIMEVVEDGVALALCAANVVNAEIVCAKVFMTEENIVTVAVEIMLETPGSLPNIFDAMMDALDSGADSFLSTFEAFNKESVEEETE
jgi:hypothetical protein